MRRALFLSRFAAVALMATLMCPALSRGDGGLFGPNNQDRQRWFVSPTVNLSSTANTPILPVATIDSCIVTCPAGDSIFTVNAHHRFTGLPYEGVDFVLFLIYCPNVRVEPAIPPGQYQLFPDAVLNPTNSSGRADFALAAGGVCGGAQVRVYCAGNLIASRSVASFDQDGDLGVGVADLALVSAKIGTTDPTADFDCDGAVTPGDYEIAAAHLGHAHPSVVGVANAAAIEFGIRATPNPSPGAVEFELRAPESGRARLAIYDVAGRRLAKVLDREIEAGVRRVSWSGRDDAGRAVASGVYRYRLTVGAREAQGALVVAR